jgi:CAS/CSE protein, C-terminus
MHDSHFCGCLQALAQMLLEVCKNPRNPGFNHYLFEVRARVSARDGMHAHGCGVLQRARMLSLTL